MRYGSVVGVVYGPCILLLQAMEVEVRWYSGGEALGFSGGMWWWCSGCEVCAV